MTSTRICLVGATGLIGSALIREGVGREDVRLVAVARREVPLPKGARMEVLVADPAAWPDAIAASRASVLACALGTTWRNSGKNEAAFRAVDHDLIIGCAQAAKAAGIDHVILVSSGGANPHSRSRYFRMKGETEQALIKLKFRRLDIIRPGLLRGVRTERRLLERFAMLVSPLTDALMFGRARRYRSISDHTVARAIIGLAKEKAGGRFILDHDSILRAARRGLSPGHG